MRCVPARWWLSDHDTLGVHQGMEETENREADESGRRILACHFFTLLLGAEPDILYIIVNDISFLSGFYKSKGDVRIWQER